MVNPDDNEPGTEPGSRRALGRYEILATVGRGGAGIVYRARDRELGRIVALKVLKDGEDAPPGLIERFHREASLAGRLRHPNIVAIHDVGEVLDAGFSGPVRYIAMDYIDGPTLNQELPHLQGRWRELAGLLEKIALAVHFAHEHGVVHRDLKPQNILLDERGEPVLTDFGLAKELDSATGVTKTGSVLGTPFYMSPEQVRGESKTVDARSDVYAIGVILYEMLSGRPPFVGTVASDVYRQIIESDPPPLPGAPPELATISLKAMAKERDRRYPSAAELADDLRRYLSGEPIRAKPPSVFYRLRKKLARHRTALVATTCAIAAAAVVAVVVLQVMRRKMRAKEESSRGLSDEIARERAKEDARRRAQPSLEKARECADQAERLYFLPNIGSGESYRKYEQAVEYARQALKEDPDSAEAYVVLGRAGMRMTKSEEAIADLTRAIERNPELAAAYFYRARTRLGLYLMRNRDPDLAPRVMSDLRKLRSLNHSKEEELYIELLLDYCDGRLKEVIQAWQDRRDQIRTIPDAHEILCIIGRALSDSNRLEEAVAAYKDAVSFCPNHYIALALMGVDQAKLGRAKESDECFAAVARTYQVHYWILDMQAHAQLSLRRYPEALEVLNRLLEMKPDYTLGWISRGYCRIYLKDFENAEKDLRHATELDPRASKAHNNLGLVLSSTGRTEEALKEYVTAMELDPNDAYSPCNCGLIHLKAGRRDEAIRAFDESIRRDARYKDAWDSKALVLFELRRWQEAAECYEKLLEIGPRTALTLSRLGAAWGQAGDLDKAQAAFEEGLRVDPKSAPVWTNLGNLHLARGRSREAEECFTKAIGFDPTFIDAFFNRGQARLNLKEFEKAAEDLEKYVAAYPDRENGHICLGEAYYQLGQWQKCIEQLEKVGNPSQLVRGRLEEARKHAKE